MPTVSPKSSQPIAPPAHPTEEARERAAAESADLVQRLLRGDADALSEACERMNHPLTRRAVLAGLAAASREAYRRLEEVEASSRERVLPAMYRGRSRHGDVELLDVEVGGQRLYARLPASDGTAPDSVPGVRELRVGDEISIAQIGDGPPMVVRSVGRPFETTGARGLVVDSTRGDDGSLFLTIESEGHEITCRATGRVEEAFASGEVDDLGGLPVVAVHSRGFVWSIERLRGKAERGDDEIREVTLDDHAGYRSEREKVTSEVARRVLQLEPHILTDTIGTRREFLRATFPGVLLSGEAGVGKTFLILAEYGSLQRDIGVPKLRAKYAALRLWGALHPESAAFGVAGRPAVGEARGELCEALAAQYAGIRSFGYRVADPQVPMASDPSLLEFSRRLLEGYGIRSERAVHKLHELRPLRDAGRSPFLFLRFRKEDFLKPFVGEGVNALAAQLRRARKHDDLVVLWIPEAEILLAHRGHSTRYYTDELVTTLLEALSGPTELDNAFVFADTNRRDMIDIAFGGRRLEAIRFGGLRAEDRPAVIRAILHRNGATEREVDELSERFLDLVYCETQPLSELVFVDGSRQGVLFERVLTPAVVENIVRRATGVVAASGRNALTALDLDDAWRKEIESQTNRFSQESLVEILGLDAITANKVVGVRRRGER